jgi:hypothetical protein
MTMNKVKVIGAVGAVLGANGNHFYIDILVLTASNRKDNTNEESIKESK